MKTYSITLAFDNIQGVLATDLEISTAEAYITSTKKAAQDMGYSITHEDHTLTVKTHDKTLVFKII